MTDYVTAVWAKPFAMDEPQICQFAKGSTLLDIAQNFQALPKRFMDSGSIHINGVEVYREHWGLIKPKTSTRENPIIVTFHAPLAGGGGGKQVIGLVAALALSVATLGIGMLGIPFLAIPAGSFAAKAIALSVGLIGSLAVSALTKPPAVNQARPDAQSVGKEESLSPASVEANILEQNSAIPRVIGTRKVYPSLIAEPLVEIVGNNEIVEAVYALNGPHSLDEIYLDTSAIGDTEDVEYDTWEGWHDDFPFDFVTRQARTLLPQIAMSEHTLNDHEDQDQIDKLFPENNLPLWHGVSSRVDPDEIWLQFGLPEGLALVTSLGDQQAIPVRIRLRKKGDTTWINLPEIHFSHSATKQLYAQVKIVWADFPQNHVQVPRSNGWYYATKYVYAQSQAPGSDVWDAHLSFQRASSVLYMSHGVVSNGGVENTILDGTTAKFYMDEATFPKGIYEIEVKRGLAYDVSLFTKTNYDYDGNTRSFFDYFKAGETNKIPVTKKDYVDRLILQRVCSVWNETPVPYPGLALIAIRATNRGVERLSVVASGYVRDWGGSAWDTWTTTSNPAPHYRDILTGSLNLDPLPEALVDDANLVAWRSACATNSYTCDLVAEGGGIAEVLDLVAGTGYAKSYQSELWGVVRDYDRSAEDPVQVFTPRNMRGFHFKKAFPRLPDALRVSYRPAAEDYNIQQITVNRPDKEPAFDGFIEQVTYDGIDTEAKIRQRALFDLKQGVYRNAFYEFEAPKEALRCRRGSLIGVSHDVLQKHLAWGRIAQVTTSGGNITSIILDTKVTLTVNGLIQSVTSMQGVTSMQDIGIQMGMGIRKTDNTFSVYPISNASGTTSVIVPSPAITDSTTTGGPWDDATISLIEPGCLVYFGPTDVEYIRLIVTDIRWSQNFLAKITAVDEAPEIWN